MLGKPKKPPTYLSTEEGPKQACSIYPSLEKFWRRNVEITLRNLTGNLLTIVRDTDQVKDVQKGHGPLVEPLTGDAKPFVWEWVK